MRPRTNSKSNGINRARDDGGASGSGNNVPPSTTSSRQSVPALTRMKIDRQGQDSCGVAAASNKKVTLMLNAKSGTARAGATLAASSTRSTTAPASSPPIKTPAAPATAASYEDSRFPPSAADIATSPFPLAFQYPLLRNNSPQTYREAAKQLVSERPELAWVRDQRPTRFNLDPLLATTSTPAPPRPPPRATGTSSRNIILDEVERVRRALSLTKIVHADLLIYDAGSLLGWHQDSFDRKRHLCTVVLELVRGGNELEEQSFRPGTHVDSCAVSLHSSVCRMPPKPMPMEKVEGNRATSSRRDNENNDCTTSTGVEIAPCNGIGADHRPARQEWCLIDRKSSSSKDGVDKPVLRHAGARAEIWEIPAEANLSIHGVAANNRLAHRFVCSASSANGKNSDPRICLVLFSWSEELAEQAQKQDLIVDMHKWWTEDLNQFL